MTDHIQWWQWPNARTTMPPGAPEAIDEVGRTLGPTGDDAALRAHNLGFLHAIMALMAIKGTPPGQAKRIVYASFVYADGGGPRGVVAPDVRRGRERP